MKSVESHPRSNCPITTSLDIFGDKWTLVIVRDMLNGKSKFNEFLDSPERITSSVLTKRLEAMTLHGLATKRPYQTHPARHRYFLTKKGAALGPVLLKMSEWAGQFYKATWDLPEGFGIQKSPRL